MTTHRFELVAVKEPGYGSNFAAACYHCGARLWSGDGDVWADLDGPAFLAYYCEPCKKKAAP